MTNPTASNATPATTTGTTSVTPGVNPEANKPAAEVAEVVTGDTQAVAAAEKSDQVVMHLHGPRTRAGGYNYTHVQLTLADGKYYTVPVNEDVLVDADVAEACANGVLPDGYSWRDPKTEAATDNAEADKSATGGSGTKSKSGK